MAEHHFYDKPLHGVYGVGVDGNGEALAVVEFGHNDYGFRHICKRWPDEREPDDEFIKVVAPRLTNHTITGSTERLTIRASILCPDCGLHGFVTDGRWADCG